MSEKSKHPVEDPQTIINLWRLTMAQQLGGDAALSDEWERLFPEEGGAAGKEVPARDLEREISELMAEVDELSADRREEFMRVLAAVTEDFMILRRTHNLKALGKE